MVMLMPAGPVWGSMSQVSNIHTWGQGGGHIHGLVAANVRGYFLFSHGSDLASIDAATFFDWNHSAVTLHVCDLYRAPYRSIPVPCQRLFRRRHNPTVSRERTQRPGKKSLGPIFL